ncbi:TetR/AcrR family transcriptional regulator [Pendulispora albinea]|uniref:TetR family transcriptional regulator n=1 Tax=Pendulispora albinea TaxID=2741071 RepID=A0ABZ2LY58_9BACT
MARRTAEEAAKTRDAILDAGLQTFAELGFAAAQLEEIAKRAGVTRGAFYHHFTNKADLYLAVLRERWAKVMAPVLDELRGPKKPKAKIRAFVCAFVRAVQREPAMQALMQMSLSGDTNLPEFHGSLSDKRDVLDALTRDLGALIDEGGRLGDGITRARAILIFLNGIAVSAALQPDSISAPPERFAELLLDGVLR